jgi:hypothetical protein
MSVCKNRTELENQIKLLADISWFTPSQQDLYNNLIPFLSSFHKVINIYGLQGVGKTFFAHVLCKAKLVDFISSPDQLRPANLPLAIDNANFDRMAVRGIRNEARRFEIKQVILITRYRAEDSIPVFALELLPKDLEVFRSNLFRNLNLKIKEVSTLNLWEHLKLFGGENG